MVWSNGHLTFNSALLYQIRTGSHSQRSWDTHSLLALGWTPLERHWREGTCRTCLSHSKLLLEPSALSYTCFKVESDERAWEGSEKISFSKSLRGQKAVTATNGSG